MSLIYSISRQLDRQNIISIIRCYSSVSRQTVIVSRQNFRPSQIRNESNLAKLRKNTGYAFSLCRKALEQNDQDLMKAEKWLRAEAAKQGWEKAERVKSRTTGHGLIGIYTSPDNQQATMVEVKCETDFVTRNEHFVRLVCELAKSLAQIGPKKQSFKSVEKTWIVEEAKLQEIGGKLVVEAIQKLGENVRFIRGCIVNIEAESNPETRLMPYVHAVAGKIESGDKHILLGKYGTIVAIVLRKKANVENDSLEEIDTTQVSNNLEEIGSRLGQHIIGLSPKTVNSVEPKKNQNQQGNVTGDEEPTELLKQKFIFNEEITVEQFLKNSNAEIFDFVRFECGEKLENKD